MSDLKPPTAQREGGLVLPPRLNPEAILLDAILALTSEISACTAELRAFREAWDRPTGPARGLITNIRSISEHRHRTGYRMGFGPAYVETEEQL